METANIPDPERMLRALLLVLEVEPTEVFNTEDNEEFVDYQSELTM